NRPLRGGGPVLGVRRRLRLEQPRRDLAGGGDPRGGNVIDDHVAQHLEAVPREIPGQLVRRRHIGRAGRRIARRVIVGVDDPGGPEAAGTVDDLPLEAGARSALRIAPLLDAQPHFRSEMSSMPTWPSTSRPCRAKSLASLYVVATSAVLGVGSPDG